MTTLDTLQRTAENNVHLTFEEYAALREPAVVAVINDYAAKLIDAAKKAGEALTLDDAREIARKQIPSTFVPEWMKNLRISANIAGTELCYLEGIKQQLEGISELLQIAIDDKIDAYIERHAGDFRRMDADKGEEVKNE
jgi:hypothetical protein